MPGAGAADRARMFVRIARLALMLAIVVASLGATTSPAQAALRLPFLDPPPPPPPVIPPVAEKLTRDPADGVVRGTVVLVHAGGWVGHNAEAQESLFQTPGDVFLARGWRVVSIDYD